MIQLDVGAETERLLRHYAQMVGQPVEAYLRRILEFGNVQLASDSSGVLDRILDDLSSPLPSDATLPLDFSRSDIYFDHD